MDMRCHLAKHLVRIFGNKNVSKLQSWLKFILTFRKDYCEAENVKSCIGGGKLVVFMIDGKTLHGGLSDRLRGLFSTYLYCKKKGYVFKVYWVYPFRLQDYLMPANIDWLINKDDLCFNKKQVAFRYFNSYSFMSDDEKAYFKALNTKKKEEHIYSNITLREDLFKQFFHDLFVPAPRLQYAIDVCLREINSTYVSISFRFIGLLGDFNDRPDLYPALGSDEEKRIYVEKCLSAIEHLHNEFTECKILVTADSSLFLNEVKRIPYAYVIKGLVGHMDNIANDNYDLHAKTFLDMIMISMAERCFIYSYGRMYGATRFAKTAALIGGKHVEFLSE